MSDIALTPEGFELLRLLKKGSVRSQDPRVNVLVAVDLMDAGLIHVSSKDGSIAISDRGLRLVTEPQRLN